MAENGTSNEQATKEKVGLGLVTTLYRQNVGAWFERYGWLKNPEGIVTQFPKLKPRIVQQRMFKEAYRCLHLGIPCLMMVLKPRKDGASTGAQAIIYHWLRYWGGRAAACMGDITGTSDTIFELFRGFAQNDRFNWGESSLASGDLLGVDDITLPNGSTYKKVTAGSTNANRSGTIQVANMTEVAFYPLSKERDPALGFLGSWTATGASSLAIQDSTANGPVGTFYEYWMDKSNSWAKIFVAWFEEPEHALPFEDEYERDRFALSLEEHEREEQSRFGVTLEQLKWRRKMIKDKCGGSVDSFRQEFPSDADEAFLRRSRLRFSASVIERMERMATAYPPKVGSLHDIDRDGDKVAVFSPDPQGDVNIYEEPRYGLKYLGVMDVCSGRDQQSQSKAADPDWHSLGVIRSGYIDSGDGKSYPPMLAAHHWSRHEASVACALMAAMCRYYGKCIAFIEVNGVGLYPVNEVARLGIPIFARKRAGADSATVTSPGWDTSENTRKLVIDNLGSALVDWKPEEPTIVVPSLHAIQQLKKFIFTSSGRVEAMPGEHDDDVLMLCIGYYNRSAATEYREPRFRRHSVEQLLRRERWGTVEMLRRGG